jgi:hypothetical protein
VVENRAGWKAHEQMAVLIPGAVLVVAEHSNHLIPEKQPDIIIEVTGQVIRLSRPAARIPKTRSLGAKQQGEIVGADHRGG